MNVRTGQKSTASEPISAVAGERVTLPCSTTLATPVDWYYLPSENERGYVICAAGNLINGYSGRFEIDRRAKGDYNLIIQSVKREDDGVYICREDVGLGTTHHMTLRVQNSKHYCVVFYPRDALHSAVFAVVRCPSVYHTPVLCLNG